MAPVQAAPRARACAGPCGAWQHQGVLGRPSDPGAAEELADGPRGSGQRAAHARLAFGLSGAGGNGSKFLGGLEGGKLLRPKQTHKNI